MLSYIEEAELIMEFLGNTRIHVTVAEAAQRRKVFQRGGSCQLIIYMVDLLTDLSGGEAAVAGPHGIVPAPAVVIGPDMTNFEFGNREGASSHQLRIVQRLLKWTFDQQAV